MPDYKPPRHGVTLSEALHEAAAIAPITRAMLTTMELWHPAGTPEGPIYVVNDRVPLTATKESDATRDAGAPVEWMACPMKISRAEESDGEAAPEVTISVAAVSGVMSDALRRARGSLEPWVVIERLYAADDTSGPAILPPMQLYVTGVDIAGNGVQLRCGYGDSVNTQIPRLNFRRAEYPGLVR